MMRQMLFLVLMSSTLWAQSSGAQPSPSTQHTQHQADAEQSPTQPWPGEADDDLAQMRNDLNHMESLLNNMSSEITFLQDQNLQILLNTNARMWTMLIRDLRRQIDREERRRGGKTRPSPEVPQDKPRP